MNAAKQWRAYVSVVLLCALGAPGAANAAPSKQACIDANEKAQDLRHDGRFLEAREMLRSCADAACPTMIRNDCARRLVELESVQPTIAFEVKDSAGSDIASVKLSIDGKPLVEPRRGAALDVDPGPHAFAFEAQGFMPVSRTLVITEGQRGRHERIELVSTATATAPATTPVSPTHPATLPVPSRRKAEDPEQSNRSVRRGGGLAIAGLGAAGLAAGSVFGLMTMAQSSQQNKDCASSSCSAAGHAAAVDDHANASSYGTIATVTFIAGAALLGGGLALYLTTPRAEAPASAPATERTSRLVVAPSIGPGGGGVLLRSEF